jgi:hypothetical protein
MKNIHVLSTDKQSRLHLKSDGFYLTKEENSFIPYSYPKNIYITSDEDINENDYIINKDGRLVQVSYLLSKDLQEASKIILTTDQDLIKDDVQSIDDEFLEWFVKNPSCEEVDVANSLVRTSSFDWRTDYKIIIPKEEAKQETLEELKKWKEEALIAHEINQKVIEKLMAEKKLMYSKEDMIKAIKFSAYGLYGWQIREQGYFDEQVKRFLKTLKNK